MPIVRTYACPDCGHFMEVVLAPEEWNAEPPWCPRCAEANMRQEFKAPAIGGSNVFKAAELAQTIAREDYGVADMQSDRRVGGKPKVRYKDDTRPSERNAATWGVAQNALETAIASGRQTRLKHGSGLDVLHQALKDGSQPDLIELSKKRSMRVW
jgi:hypothetical protein